MERKKCYPQMQINNLIDDVIANAMHYGKSVLQRFPI